MMRSLHSVAAAGIGLAAVPFSTHAELDWTPTPGPAGGSVRALDLAGSAGVASTIAGLHTSADGGRTWRGAFRSPGAPQATFGFVAAVPGALFAQNTALEFFASTDGLHWSHANPPVPGVALHAIEHANGRTYAQLDPAAGQPLYFSDDLGETWSPLMNSPTPADGLSASGNDVFTSTLELRDGGFTRIVTAYRSGDRGQTFAVIGGSDASVNGIAPSQAATPRRVGTRLLCGQFVSENDGQSWRFFDAFETLRQQFCGADFCEFRVASSAVVNGAMYVHTYLDFMDQDEPADNFKLWKTTDFATFTEVPASPALPDLLVSQSFWREGASGALVIAGALGIFRSDDGGVNWTASNAGINASVVWRMEATASVLIANLVDTNYVARLTSPLGPWSQNTIFDNGAFFGTVMSLYSPDGQTLLAGHLIDGLTRSDDGGHTWDWSRAGVPQYNGTAGEQYCEIEAFTKTPTALFAGTGEGLEFRSDGGQGFVHVGRGVLRSADNGRTWARVNNGLRIIGRNSFFEPQYDPILSMTTAPTATSPAVLAGGMFLGVARSTNNGASWSYTNSGLPMFNADVAASEVTALTTVGGAVYLGFNGIDQDVFPGVGSVYKSTDGGLTWTPANSGLPTGFPVAAITAHNGTLYAGLASRHFPATPFMFGGLGVYQSTDGGASWQPAGTSLSGVGVRCLKVFNGTLYAGTDHLGVWALTSPITGCGSADFNGDGDTGTDQDIEAFFACIGGHCCPTCDPRGSDFNNDGDAATDQDIEAFFRVLGGNPC
ncbi:MAG TPA: sialidase family protein [Phycisphaerales bacterium]|nr:sialidase family protein [Phycisphaerales bacterium]